MQETLSWDAQTLRTAMAANPAIRIIDVRSAAEFESEHIPGALNIPMSTLEEHVGRIREAVDDPIVFVCQMGARAEKAKQMTAADIDARALADGGLGHVHFLAGGLRAWEQAGGDLKRGRRVWSAERQVRFITGSIVVISILLSEFVPALKWVALLIGLGLTFAAWTNFCGLEQLLARLPWNRATRPSPDVVVEQLIAASRRSA